MAPHRIHREASSLMDSHLNLWSYAIRKIAEHTNCSTVQPGMLPRDSIKIAIEQRLSDWSVPTSCFVLIQREKANGTSDQKRLTHLEGIFIDICNEDAYVLVKTAFIGELEVFISVAK